MDAGFLLLPEFTPAPLRTDISRRRRPATRMPRPAVKVHHLAPREYLFVEGDPSNDVHEVASGAVLVVRTLPDGRRQIVDVVGPGRLFGLTASDRHRCSAVASTDAVVCRLDRDVAARHPLIADRLGRAALVEIDRLRDLALALGRKSALERVAGFLLSLVGEPTSTSAEIHLPVTRAELADHLGLTLETVSRTTSRLKRDGLVVEDRGDRFVIADCRRLAEIAAGRGAAAA
ncbi:MAG: Crp/Fnr family transcriptional regulator [Siculibacillus sp.]|nr:Crp/Fnr family transcriptional regulator [Siculibacillus sp.]